MIKRKYIKFTFCVLLLFAAMFAIRPSEFNLGVFSSTWHVFQIEQPKSVNSGSIPESESKKYDKPIYFNIFKFIFSFIPNRERNAQHILENLSKRTFNLIASTR